MVSDHLTPVFVLGVINRSSIDKTMGRRLGYSFEAVQISPLRYFMLLVDEEEVSLWVKKAIGGGAETRLVFG